ncbi:MAG: SprT-like domain-containing protein [Gammaproteobacteria bacterium]|nr:SprT-like domain-containing protein [Gammaproteobacteria bacterium]
MKYLSQQQKDQLVKATVDCIDKANLLLPDQRIEPVDVTFDIRGTKAGEYRPLELRIRYNPHIAANQFDEFVGRTVVHEVAHHVVRQVYSRRVRAHGREWRSVMRMLGATDINRCHRYDMSGVKVKSQRRFLYRCHCREHQITTTRHNRSLRGTVYRCVACRLPLVFVG